LPRLILDGISKTFAGGVRALDGFSLDIAEKEFVAVVGPSGCGKSTLLRIIAGLEEESAGRIILDGKELNGLPPRDRDMAIMFQNYALFPHMTVADNMAFGLKLRKTPREEIVKRVEEAARLLGIADLLARYPAEMSGGQRQRAALGRAILRRPKVFLFDEPLSNLDAKMRAQMRVEIARLHQSLDSTMIFVTHDQVEAMTMGDRVVVLKDGVIQQAAPPDELYRRPANAFVAGFIGSPGMNFFPGRLAGEAGAPVFQSPWFSWKVPADKARRVAGYAGKEILFGIRPEDIGSAEARRALSADGAPTLRGAIGVVERLGGQACIYMTTEAGIAFAARPDTAEGCQPGHSLELPLLAAHGIFFDPVSEKALF
jgi:multiple sugar transport system ATP-binding protein